MDYPDIDPNLDNLKQKIDPKVKEAWLAALESGEYVKGKFALKSTPFAGDDPDDVNFCCLGVLCEVAKKQGVITEYKAKSSYPPTEVSEWAGIDHDAELELADVNDSVESFKPVIELIKKHL
jgi:hypothetical protein